MSNMYVVDGLDITSGIRQGVLNLTPNPESIQETSVQVNTYSSEYSRATGVQEVMTTKSGSDQFHGVAEDFFYYQNMFATTHFSAPKYLPFHGNNMSFAIGGPIIPHHQFFFYFAVEPLRSSAATGGATINSPDPQFAAWAQQNYPATFGTKILNTYAPTGLAGSAVSTTADVHLLGAPCPTGQTTIPVPGSATGSIPC